MTLWQTFVFWCVVLFMIKGRVSNSPMSHRSDYLFSTRRTHYDLAYSPRRPFVLQAQSQRLTGSFPRRVSLFEGVLSADHCPGIQAVAPKTETYVSDHEDQPVPGGTVSCPDRTCLYRCVVFCNELSQAL